MMMKWDDAEGHRIPGSFEVEEAGDGTLEVVRDDVRDWDEMRERLTFEDRERGFLFDDPALRLDLEMDRGTDV